MKEKVPPGCVDAELCCSVAGIAKALGHPTRIRILRILLEREDCICGAFVEDLGLPQSTVSQHLKMMKDAGLIRGGTDGPRVCYCLDREVFKSFQRTIANFEIQHQEIP